jgi:hypothetical protein
MGRAFGTEVTTSSSNLPIKALWKTTGEFWWTRQPLWTIWIVASLEPEMVRMAALLRSRRISKTAMLEANGGDFPGEPQPPPQGTAASPDIGEA